MSLETLDSLTAQQRQQRTAILRYGVFCMNTIRLDDGTIVLDLEDIDGHEWLVAVDPSGEVHATD